MIDNHSIVIFVIENGDWFVDSSTDSGGNRKNAVESCQLGPFGFNAQFLASFQSCQIFVWAVTVKKLTIFEPTHSKNEK